MARDVPFTVTTCTRGQEHPTEHRDVETLTIRIPGAPEISVALDEARGLVFLVENGLDSEQLHQFELRPGAANVFFARVHSYPHTPTPGGPEATTAR